MLDVLIIGGDSMIGSALKQDLTARGMRTASTSRRASDGPDSVFLDLAAADTEWPDLPVAKTWVITAAIAHLAACRQDPVTSHRVNVAAMRSLTDRAVAQDVRLIFLSSDQVFDGSRPHRPATDAVCPRSVYGRQKAQAEDMVLAASQDNLVIRLTKVLSVDDALFTGWRSSLTRSEAITPFTDKTFAPVMLDTVTNGIGLSIAREISGILQFSGPRDIDYASSARHLADILGAGAEYVQPITAAGIGMPAEERPPFTSLDTRRAEQSLGLAFAAPHDLIEQTYA